MLPMQPMFLRAGREASFAPASRTGPGVECVHDKPRVSYFAQGLVETSNQWEWKQRCQIIEFAAIDIITGESFSVRCRPQFSWQDVRSHAARRFAEEHGHHEIIEDMGLPRFEEIWHSELIPFLQRVAGGTGNVVLLAHNGAAFDEFVLKKEIARLQLDMSCCPTLMYVDPVSAVKALDDCHLLLDVLRHAPYVADALAAQICNMIGLHVPDRASMLRNRLQNPLNIRDPLSAPRIFEYCGKWYLLKTMPCCTGWVGCASPPPTPPPDETMIPPPPPPTPAPDETMRVPVPEPTVFAADLCSGHDSLKKEISKEKRTKKHRADWWDGYWGDHGHDWWAWSSCGGAKGKGGKSKAKGGKTASPVAAATHLARRLPESTQKSAEDTVVEAGRFVLDGSLLSFLWVPIGSLDRCGWAPLEFTLVKRPEEQARWLSDMREGHVRLLKDAPLHIRADPEVIFAAVAACGQSLEHAAEALRADRAIALAAVQSDWRALQFVDEALRDDRQLVLTAVKQDWCALQFASDSLRSDREIALAAISQGWGAILFVDPSLRADPAFLLSALKTGQCRLEIAACNLRDNKEVVMAAVENHGLSLADASPALQADKEVVLTAVGQDWRALRHACRALRGDREVARRAVGQDPRALLLTTAQLQGDLNFTMAAVAQHGRALEHASKALRGNRQVAIAAVRQDGEALEFASEELRGDEEVALAALEQNWRAHRYVAPGLWLKSDFCHRAVQRSWRILSILPPEQTLRPRSLKGFRLRRDEGPVF
ncbi:unnamed protein product [Symbiodinium sp. CCMP2456]|nr:unnamed protein product [Symbiodinium sp. CCMP2456]